MRIFCFLSHAFWSPAQQDQLLINPDDPSATSSEHSRAVEADEPQSPQPPMASAAAEAAMGDIVTGPTASADTDPNVAANGCLSHAAEVLRPLMLPSLSGLMPI